MLTALADPPEAPPAAVVPRVRPGRVLYAADLDASRKFGTMEEQAFLLASAFRDRGGLFLPAFPAAPEPVGLAHYREAGLDFAVLDLTRFRPATLAALLRLIARHGIEVIDWNFYPPLTNRYVWALSVLAPGLRHYFTDHNSRSGVRGKGRLRAVKRLLFGRYSRVIGVSQFVADDLRGRGLHPAPDCRPHFVNTDRFAPDPAARAATRARLGAGGRFVLLAVAHLIPEKGVDVALRALAALPESAVLWVVGDGPEAGPLAALARELGVSGRARFLGPQVCVEPTMQAADALVCPSRWAEAAGLVNIEAQACGLPVLASRTGGIPEYVSDGRTGLLFPPGDHAALAAAARRLLDDPRLAADMGREARGRAVAEFSPEARLDGYLDLYRFPPSPPRGEGRKGNPSPPGERGRGEGGPTKGAGR